jgi:hypothetical protein
VLQSVERGKMSITMNNEQGKYFRAYKGLRQGDPLSPLLFNVVVDVLAEMLDSARKKGRIKGVVPNLVERGISHLQYADDTVVLIQDDEESILNLKLILYCFENMSGMRINYHKSELYIMGVDSSREEEIAAKLNYKLWSFLMVYLGILVHKNKLRR